MNEMKEENGRRITFRPSLLDVIVSHTRELELDKVLDMRPEDGEGDNSERTQI